jgi:hypothetical protein
MKLSEAASGNHNHLPCTVTHYEQRGRAKHRDSENCKAVPRIFYGVKIVPLPLPALSPRVAVPCGVAQPVPGAQ